METLLDAGFLSLQDDSLLGQLLPFGQERFLFLEELLPRPLGPGQFLLQGRELFRQSCQFLFAVLDFGFLLLGFLFPSGDLQLGLFSQLIDGLDPGVQGFQLAFPCIDGNQGILVPAGSRFQPGPLFHQSLTEGLGRFFPFQIVIFQLLHFGGQFLDLGLERQESLCSLPFFLQKHFHCFLLLLFLSRFLLDPRLSPGFFHFDFLEFFQTLLPGFSLFPTPLGQGFQLLLTGSAGRFQLLGFLRELPDFLFPGEETFSRLLLTAAEGTARIDHIPF